MPYIKIGNLTTFTGDTSGSWIVMNDETNAVTYKVQRETFTSGLATTGENQFNGNQSITGSVLFSGGASIVPAGPNIDLVAGPGGWSELASNDGDQYIWVDDAAAYIGTNWTSGSRAWTFNRSGSLYSPGDITIPAASLLYGTASYVLTASYLSNYIPPFPYTGSAGISGSLNVTGPVQIVGNLTVLGSSSIQYITSSQLNIGTNIITVNTATPVVRFGGLAVYDSGSTGTGLTGSMLWDSQNNTWIYSNPSGSSYDGAMVLMGPRNYTGLGNEVGISTNYLAKGDGSHHMSSSQISDDGTTVTIPGRLSVSSGITGSLFGTSSWAQNVPASGVTGLNLSQIATGSVSASVNVNSASFQITSGSSTFLFVSNSGRVNIGATSSTAALTVGGGSLVVGSGYGYGTTYGSTSDGILQITDANAALLAGGSYPTQIVLRQAGNVANQNSNYWGTIEQSAGGMLINSGKYLALYLRAGGVGSTQDTYFQQSNTATSMTIKGSTSNVLIGTTTDSGYKLLVATSGASGSLNVNNVLVVSGSSVQVTGSLAVSGSSHVITGSLGINGSTTIDSTLYVSNNNVGIGITSSAAYKLDVNGTARVQGNLTSNGLLDFTRNSASLVRHRLNNDQAGNNQIDLAIGKSDNSNTLFLGINSTSFGTLPNTYVDAINSGLYIRAGGLYVLTSTTLDGGLANVTFKRAASNTLSRFQWQTSSTIDWYFGYRGTASNAKITWESATAGLYTLFPNTNNFCISNVVDETDIPSALLFVNSTTKGFLPPRMTGAQRTAISAPAQGLQVYDTGSATEGIWYYNSGSLKSWTRVLNDSGSQTITGSLNATLSVSSSQVLISGSGVSRLTIVGSGSSSPLMTVIGSQGELFSVNDTLSGSLFSVNDISGLPVLEAFSDNRVLLGSYQAPALYTTVKVNSVAGNNVIYQNLPTASYDGLFVSYTARSGSNVKVGQLTGMWSASAVLFTEFGTSSFGDVTGLGFTMIVTGSNMAVTASTSTANWSIKTIIRSV